MIQAILWDMDGVLVDTTEAHFWSWSIALKEHGLKLSRQEFLSTFGKNNRATLHQLFGPLPEEVIIGITDRKEVLFRQNLDGQVEVYPGVLDWLKYAQDQHILCAIASSAPLENINAVLEHFDMGMYFTALISASEMPSKPDPAVFLAAANALNISLKNCLVVEDAPSGASAAKSTGMHCLVVLTTRTQPEFPEVDFFLNRLSDISPFEILNKIDQAA